MSFYPISPLVGITNTSHAAQAGVMDEKWACRVVRGKKIIAEKTMIDMGLENFVGVIYGHIKMEGLSRHAVAMCAGRLLQFARKYQDAGVCPNFEIPELVRGEALPDVSDETQATGDQPGAAEAVQDEGFAFAPVGQLPAVSLSIKGLWEKSIDGHGVLLCQMAAYGAGLPEGHLASMFEQTANQMIRRWIDTNDPLNLVIRFGEFMFSCSNESQVPRTGTDNVNIEVSPCKILQVAREMDPTGSILPPGYPCAFHEMIAKKVSEISDLRIIVNTSSTGCSVDMRFNQ
ncbi:MAG: hypothetical protein ACTSU3_07610 [Candidatus Thorarchaeota archaeon]